MYICNNSNKFYVSDVCADALVRINPPKYFMDDSIYEIKGITRTGDDIEEYADDQFSVNVRIAQENEHLFKVVRTWKNISGKKIKLQTIFEIEEMYHAEKFLIPCVNFNGNEFGKGKEPKGLECEGKPWVFSYDRISIPSCSLTENKDYTVALFASPDDDASMQSACSVIQKDGRFYQRIIHPEKEAPYTYSSRDTYCGEFNKYFELQPNQEIETEMYIYAGVPKWENFGVAGLLDEVLDKIDVGSRNAPDYEKIWKDSIAYAKHLISDCDEKKAFIIGCWPDDKNGFEYGWKHFQLAWCGQNALLARMLICDYIKYRNDENLYTAVEIIDHWVNACVAENGLMAVQMEDYSNLNIAKADVCNLGYGAYELLKIYELLKNIGINKQSCFDASRSLCDFFVNHYSEEEAFGKLWSLKGECLETGGTIGAFMIPPMCKMYEMTGEKKYLDTAITAMEFYCTKDLDQFVCTAGALDTCCVDKETSAPLIMSGIMLYEITKEARFLEYAVKAAYYFTSWMYHYTPVYDKESDIVKQNVNIIGYTAVSAQHHHIDDYAGLVAPYIGILSKYTGDCRWEKRAAMMINAVMQNVSDGTDEIHGRIRPRGAKNEAIFHCRWNGFGKMKDAMVDQTRGMMNDWLVAWPCAFRLNCINEIMESGEKE